MSVRDLIPWGRNNSQTPSVYRDDDRNPFLSLHREVNRLFDDVFRGLRRLCWEPSMRWHGRRLRIARPCRYEPTNTFTR